MSTRTTPVSATISPEFLKSTDEKIRNVVAIGLPAVVALEPGNARRRGGIGSGVIVSEDGVVLTAAHVAADLGETATVIFPDGKRANAEVLGMNFFRDIAMLDITDEGEYPFVELGDSQSMTQNDFCVAMGHPRGYEQTRTPPVRFGRVMFNGNGKFIVTNATITGGDSGGPLLDLNGKLVGIHSNTGFHLSQNDHAPVSAFLADWERLARGERFGGRGVGAKASVPVLMEQEDAPNESETPVRPDRRPPSQESLQAAFEQHIRDLKKQLELPPIDPMVLDPEERTPVKDEFLHEMLNAFSPSVEEASMATHYVFLGDEWKSLCTVIHEDGFALTKASEIKNEDHQELRVLLKKGDLVSASVVQVFDEHDLALLRFEERNGGFASVTFTPNAPALPLGSLIAAAGTNSLPIAFGVVSVGSRPLPDKRQGYLGVEMEDVQSGVRLRYVRPASPADRYGLKAGDIITKINDTACNTSEDLSRTVSGFAPGTIVQIHLQRSGNAEVREVELGNLESAGRNSYGTNINNRSAGFSNVLQTDIPIVPQHCGGPVVDLDGKVIGISIARSGRTKTYVVPSSEIDELMQGPIATIIHR